MIIILKIFVTFPNIICSTYNSAASLWWKSLSRRSQVSFQQQRLAQEQSPHRISSYRWTCWAQERVQIGSTASTIWSTRLPTPQMACSLILNWSLMLLFKGLIRLVTMDFFVGWPNKDDLPSNIHWWCREPCDIDLCENVIRLWLHIYCS